MPSEHETPLYSIFGVAPSLLEPQYYHVERVSHRAMLHFGDVPAHSHPHLHQLTLWVQGTGRFFVDEAVYEVKPGTLCWMPSGTIHGFAVGPAADAIVLSISDDFAREHLGSVLRGRPDRLLHSHMVIDLTSHGSDAVTTWFEAVEREYRHADWGQPAAIGAWARLIFIELARRADDLVACDGPGSARAVLLSRFFNVLEAELRRQPNVDRVAARLGTTPYLLNIATREAMGMRTSDVIRARVMQEAKRLLLFTMISISEVAEVIGYNDPAHFSRAFKAYTGSVPSIWRAEHVAALERSRQDADERASSKPG